MLAMMATLAPFEQIAFRAIRDALLEATPEYWERRAKTFEAVGTEDADATAYACRCHAWLLRTNRDMTAYADDTMVDVLAEAVAA